MIRRKGNYKAEEREEMRGGDGKVRIEHFWDAKEELKANNRLFAKLTLEPGSSIGFHPHIDEEEVFYIVEDMPTFNGGDPATEFRKYIGQNLRYPEIAAENGISGRVIVQFAVNKVGTVVDAKVVRSVDPALDKEAIRVVMSSPKWTPGKQRGKSVKVLFTFPINFVLQ